MNVNNKMIEIDQLNVCDLIDDQFHFGNSAFLKLTNEYTTKAAIIDAYQNRDITSEQAIFGGAIVKQNMQTSQSQDADLDSENI